MLFSKFIYIDCNLSGVFIIWGVLNATQFLMFLGPKYWISALLATKWQRNPIKPLPTDVWQKHSDLLEAFFPSYHWQEIEKLPSVHLSIGKERVTTADGW